MKCFFFKYLGSPSYSIFAPALFCTGTKEQRDRETFLSRDVPWDVLYLGNPSWEARDQGLKWNIWTNLSFSNLRDQTNLVWTNICRTQDNIFPRQNNKKMLKKPSLSLFLLLRFSEIGSSWPTPGPIIIGGVPFWDYITCD